METRDTQAIDLPSVATSMPEAFEFYHLGRVNRILSEENLQCLEDPETVCLAFYLLGEVRGMLLVCFDKGLDPSVYTEMGNVLASRWADGVASAEGLTAMISPPKFLNPQAALKHLAARENHHQAYLHQHGSHAVRIETFVFPFSTEETANA